MPKAPIGSYRRSVNYYNQIEQGGSTSDNNNNPTSGHHHKGSNQQTETGEGGQELSATKKHKGSQTDQGTTTVQPQF